MDYPLEKLFGCNVLIRFSKGIIYFGKKQYCKDVQENEMKTSKAKAKRKRKEPKRMEPRK